MVAVTSISVGSGPLVVGYSECGCCSSVASAGVCAPRTRISIGIETIKEGIHR